MLSINNKVSKMDTEKLRKGKRILKRSIIAVFVIIIALFVAFVFTAAFHVAEDKPAVNCAISIVLFLFVWWFLCTNYSTIYHELVKRENLDSLSETEKQVKIKPGYHGFPERLILKRLLEGSTTTAKLIKETNKVVLRFELIDDEGKTFSKSLEFEADRIIYDLEIL